MKQRTKATTSKFNLNREGLVKTLGLLSMALPKQAVVQVLQCFVFNGKTVAAYNDSVAITAPCKAGPFAVNGPLLLGLLETSLGEEAGLDPDETHVIVRCGRTTAKLPYLAEDSFLFEEPEGAGAALLKISPEVVTALEATLLTVSTDLAKPALMGVCLISDKKQTTLYSCDGDGMTKAPVGKGGTPLRLMIPSTFCEAVLKIIADTGAEGTLYRYGNEWVEAEFGNGYHVYGRLMEIDNPLDYEDLVDRTIKKSKSVYKQVPEGLAEALIRAQVITKLETAPTVLTIDPNQRIKLFTENRLGTVRDSFTFAGHPEVEASVSAELTGRAIKLCPEMAVHANCVAYRHPDTGLFVLVSNMGQ